MSRDNVVIFLIRLLRLCFSLLFVLLLLLTRGAKIAVGVIGVVVVAVAIAVWIIAELVFKAEASALLLLFCLLGPRSCKDSNDLTSDRNRSSRK